MEKIVGAAAEDGYTLGAALRPGPESKPVWQKHGNGADLLHHTRPTAPPALKSADDEMEIGYRHSR